MTAFFTLIAAQFRLILSVLDKPLFEIFSFEVSLLQILIGCLIISILTNLLWRGAKG